MATFFNSYSIVPGEEFAAWRRDSLCLSAILLRKWKEAGEPLLLVTDAASAGQLPVNLYDDVILTDGKDGVDSKVFWAVTKLRGLRKLPAPVVSVDWDLFVLDGLLLEDIRERWAVGLHYECKTLPPYSLHRTFVSHPVNCAIIGFASAVAKQQYCDAIFKFMRDFAGPTEGAMQVAEQGVFGSLFPEVLYDAGYNGMFPDGRCSHLWGNKHWLDESEAEQAKHSAECRQVAKRFGLDIPEYGQRIEV